MNHKGIRIAMVALFVMGLAGTACAQGLYWESTMSGGPIGERNEQMWAVPKKLKGVTRETGETFIVRLDKEVFITIDPKEDLLRDDLRRNGRDDEKGGGQDGFKNGRDAKAACRNA